MVYYSLSTAHPYHISIPIVAHHRPSNVPVLHLQVFSYVAAAVPLSRKCRPAEKKALQGLVSRTSAHKHAIEAESEGWELAAAWLFGVGVGGRGV